MTLAKAIAALTGREIVNKDTIVTVDADIPAEFSSSVAMLDVDIAVDIVDEITVMDAVIVICYNEQSTVYDDHRSAWEVWVVNVIAWVV